MKKMSLKLRITLWYTLAMLIVSCIALFAVDSLGNRMIMRDIRDRVERQTDMLSHGLVGRDGRLRPIPGFRYYENGVHMLVYDGNKKIIGGTVPFGITDELSVEPGRTRESTYNSDKYCECDKEVETQSGTYYIKGITSVTDALNNVRTVTKNNIIFSLVTILIAAAGGYFMINRAFVPVNKISETAQQISKSSDLSRRINIGGSGNDEIYRLANVFDEMLDKIERAFENEKQFTSDASHELRTPVSVILSECEYMEECADTAEDYKESAASVKRQAEKMSKLISELLTISRMDRNAVALSFESADISELVSFVCDEQEEINASSGVKLERSICEGINVRADRFMITRLFINLISNAYSYIGDGDRIEVKLEKRGNNAVFSVTDNGIGIAEENLGKVWERFYQEDASRTDNGSGSMGLGLSMVKWIADAHGGSVDVKSKKGKGSTFTFTMPADGASGI